MNAFGNPFVLWSKVAFSTTEMLIASASVIGQRTTRIGLAGANPTAADIRENALMGREKIEAFTESAQQVWARTLKINQQFAALALKESMTAMKAVMAISSGRVTAEPLVQQMRLVQDSITKTAVAASSMSGAAAQITQQALAPVSARAKKNVKRLSKRKR